MRERTILSAVWLISFALLLSIVSWLHLTGRLGDQNHTLVLSQLSASFTPYVSVVLAFFFSNRRPGETRRRGAPAFAIALGLSILWNCLIVAYVARLLIGVCCVEDAMDSVRNTTAILSWLVGPAIGFYFGSRS